MIDNLCYKLVTKHMDGGMFSFSTHNNFRLLYNIGERTYPLDGTPIFVFTSIEVISRFLFRSPFHRYSKDVTILECKYGDIYMPQENSMMLNTFFDHSNAISPNNISKFWKEIKEGRVVKDPGGWDYKFVLTDIGRYEVISIPYGTLLVTWVEPIICLTVGF